jgi:hypothetical protein
METASAMDNGPSSKISGGRIALGKSCEMRCHQCNLGYNEPLVAHGLVVSR